MDGAKAYYLYLTSKVNLIKLYWVGGRGGCDEAYLVRGSETASSADLGGSSKYSSVNLEDRSGERFHENSNCSWVSRS